MAKGMEFSLEEAKAAAERFVARLRPSCERIEIVGSIRRGRPLVHDVDIVALRKEPGFMEHDAFLEAVERHCAEALRTGSERIWKVLLANPFAHRKKFPIPCDLYLATEETWATLLVVRTGSAEHNIKLAMHAQTRGMKLRASGDGVEDRRGRLITCKTEQDVFTALGLVYVPPKDRER